MDTLSIRNMILSTPLQELPVSIDGWIDPATNKPANLVIRELTGKAGSELLTSCTDVSTKSVDQEALVAGIVLATLRNADDANKALIFAMDNDPNTFNPALRDPLMATGLGRIMDVARQSIKLSGLDDAAATDAKNA